MNKFLIFLVLTLLLAGAGCSGSGGKKGDNSGKDMPQPAATGDG